MKKVRSIYWWPSNQIAFISNLASLPVCFKSQAKPTTDCQIISLAHDSILTFCLIKYRFMSVVLVVILWFVFLRIGFTCPLSLTSDFHCSRSLPFASVYGFFSLFPDSLLPASFVVLCQSRVLYQYFFCQISCLSPRLWNPILSVPNTRQNNPTT